MLLTLFIINRSNEICLEKHWSKVIPKTVCDPFFELAGNVSSPDDLPPILETPKNTLMYIYRNGLYYLAVCINESKSLSLYIGSVPPLMVIEFLQCIYATICDYFGSSNETIVKDNLVCIYEILDEMLDGGIPLATEPNILKEIVRPPNLLKTITDAVTGKQTMVGSTLPTNQLSNVRWRRTGVKYTNNEAYFDLIEEVDAIIDRSGNTITKEAHGSIDCLIKLSGMPDLTMAFTNHRLIDDASLHPSIRFLRWKRERVLSFIPPDGRFRLFTYHVNSISPLTLPLVIRHNVLLREHGRFDLILIPKTLGKAMDAVKLTVQLPPEVTNITATPSIGRTSFDLTTKVFQWNVGRVESKNPNPSLKGIVTLASDVTSPPANPVISVDFSIPQFAISGLKISRVDLYGEKYKPFKGVKYVTKAGRFEVRT